jgi:hypothetical protein
MVLTVAPVTATPTQVAARLRPMAFGPKEYIFLALDSAESMFLIRNGIVGNRGIITGAGHFFGDDMILSDFVRPYGVMSLSYLDVFRLDRKDLMEAISNDKFPTIKVCAGSQPRRLCLVLRGVTTVARHGAGRSLRCVCGVLRVLRVCCVCVVCCVCCVCVVCCVVLCCVVLCCVVLCCVVLCCVYVCVQANIRLAALRLALLEKFARPMRAGGDAWCVAPLVSINAYFPTAPSLPRCA